MAIDFSQYIGEDERDLADWLSDAPIEEIPEREIPVDKSFPTSVFVLNIPKVAESKLPKLEKVLTSVFGSAGTYELYMPINEEIGTTEGFAILTYEEADAADQAVKAYDGFKLDAKHVFKVWKMDEFDSIVDHDGEEPTEDSVKLANSEVSDLRDWMMDDLAREQFVCRFDTGDNEIYWHNSISNMAELEYDGERERKGGKVWCDSKVQWSPRGSYLATFHRPGIALWGAEKFQKRGRFMHQDVKFIDFSPNEEYLLTWNGKHAAEKDTESVRIWRMLTGEQVKSFQTPSFTPKGGEFPHFLWSADGRFLARCTDQAIFVYDSLDDFELITDPASEKKSPIKFADGLQGFDWSPKENIISAWIPEKNNVPARLQLIRIPSRQEVAAKNLFSVRDATMHWHPEGKYLCVNAMRMSRTKKTGHTHLEIFRVQEKNCPIESVEIKETVKTFNWEPAGNRFCILTTDEAGHNLKAQFYALGANECKQVAKHDLHAGISSVFWAPQGQYFVMAAIPGGDLIFGHLNEMNKLDILHKDEHFLMTEVMWDPSSRYVITAVTQQMTAGMRYQTEAGFQMWSFQGKSLYKTPKEKLYMIAWRPHPPSLLSEKKKADVKANLKTYTKKYDSLDDANKENAKAQQQKERVAQLGKFQEILDRVQAYKDSKWEVTGWKSATEELEARSPFEEITETLEDVLDVKEEVITD
jgi:translation initiation factor 3 subunit B